MQSSVVARPSRDTEAGLDYSSVHYMEYEVENKTEEYFFSKEIKMAKETIKS